MKSTVGFGFFLLFLAGFALVYMMQAGKNWEASVPTVEELSTSAWRPSHIGEMEVDDDSVFSAVIGWTATKSMSIRSALPAWPARRQ